MTPLASRQLALRLACLGDADRAWIFSRLASGERARVKGLLAGVEASGLARNRELLRAVVSDIAIPESVPTTLDAVLGRLDKPLWRALAVHLHEADAATGLAEAYDDAWSSVTAPAAWMSVLERHAGRRA